MKTDKYTTTPTHPPTPLQPPQTLTADQTHSTSHPSTTSQGTTLTVVELQDKQVQALDEIQAEDSKELLVATDSSAIEEQSAKPVDIVGKPVSLLLEQEKPVNQNLNNTSPGISESGDIAKPVKRDSSEFESESSNQNAPFGGALSLARIQSLVSMTTPRNFGQPGVTSSPPFVEFDLSIDGFGSLFLPSVFPINIDQVYIYIYLCVCVCVICTYVNVIAFLYYSLLRWLWIMVVD